MARTSRTDDSTADSTIGDAEGTTTLRRRAVLAGVAGAAAGVFVRGVRPVAATEGLGDQGYLKLGSNDRYRTEGDTINAANVSSVATMIKASPNYATYADAAGRYIFRVDARPAGNTSINGLEGLAAGAGSGVLGTSPSGTGVLGTSTTDTGVEGTGATGVLGTGSDFGVRGISTGSGLGLLGISVSGVGVVGLSSTGIGGGFQGANAAIVLVPQSVPGAPTTGNHSAGQMLVDSNGALFLCAAAGAAGSPGVWVRILDSGSTPTFRTLPTPERFIDTRSNLGGVQGPVPAGTTSTFQMTGRNGESANPALQIPDSATIIVGNLSVISGGGAPIGSFVTLWPGGPRPTTSSISFGPNAVIANSCTVGLTNVAGHGTMSVFAQQQCDYIVDVVGYYA